MTDDFALGLVAVVALHAAWTFWRMAVLAMARHLVLSVRDDVWMRIWREGGNHDDPAHVEFRAHANNTARFAHLISNIGLLPLALFLPLDDERRLDADDAPAEFSGETRTVHGLMVVSFLLLAPVPVFVLLLRALTRALLRPSNVAKDIAAAPHVTFSVLAHAGEAWPSGDDHVVA